jgi:hypothetical protein
MPLLEANVDKIHWENLSLNPNAIHLLEKNKDKINWFHLSYNKNAIFLLKDNIDKINIQNFCRNKKIFKLNNPDTSKFASILHKMFINGSKVIDIN